MTHIIVTFRFHEILQQAQDDTENLNFTDYFNSGVGVPPNLKHQADNLAKLGWEFLSVLELIAKIFGAVSRTTSLMWLSALLASKRCRCRNDGFCSGVGVPPTRIYQADNLAKLGQEFLSVLELIAKIFGAVVAAKPSLALRNGQVIAHCGCQNNGFAA